LKVEDQTSKISGSLRVVFASGAPSVLKAFIAKLAVTTALEIEEGLRIRIKLFAGT
jgi:hypothetical protein